MKYEYRFAGESTWQPTYGDTEQGAADHLARLAGSRSPVPGCYQPGTGKARKTGAGRFALPTGAVIELRAQGGEKPYRVTEVINGVSQVIGTWPTQKQALAEAERRAGANAEFFTRGEGEHRDMGYEGDRATVHVA